MAGQRRNDCGLVTAVTASPHNPRLCVRLCGRVNKLQNNMFTRAGIGNGVISRHRVFFLQPLI